jgi:autotransporter-associated beta strand protein
MGLALRIQLPWQMQSRMRQSVAAVSHGLVLAVASLGSSSVAQAQAFTWGDVGSTSNTTDYNLDTNWGNPPAGAPPVAAGQSAIFDANGSSAVTVTTGPIAPGSWTFNAASQDYVIDGAAVNFSTAGAGGGIINNANAGQLISISNPIGETVAGVRVQQLDSSILTLSGANTYSGGTIISAGALQVTNNSSVGTGAVTLNGGAFLADGSANLTFSNNFTLNAPAFGSVIDTNGISLTLSGVLSGTGVLTVTDFFGGGVLILTNTNTYSGGTTICSCATLQLGTLATQGSIVGAVTNEGAFNIVNANTAGITAITNAVSLGPAVTTFFNATSASGIAITNEFFGATVFGAAAGTDTATAGNAVIVNRTGGSTTFQAMTTADNATITNRLGGTTTFYDNSSAGNASITNRFGGQTIFGTPFGTDAPGAGNAVIVNRFAGNTEFNAFATASSATITNRFGGSTDFYDFSTAGKSKIITNNGGATFFHDNADGGTATFVTSGSGFVDFSHSVGIYNDGRINAGSIAGSGSYYIGAFNTLVVGGNHASTEVSGVIADDCGCGPFGPGNLEKVGTGTLTLSGTNTYTGATFVSEGTLLVTGSIASSTVVLVDHGATLGGTGTVPLTLLSNAAVLAPGLPTALGTLTVNDALLFCNCTFYDVKVTSTGNDLTVVAPNIFPGGGIADLAGTVRIKSLDNTYRFNSPYTILTAQGGFDGGFGPTQFNSLVLPSGINGSLSYTATNVNLTLASALGQLTGLNVNQRNVGNALDTAFNALGNSGGLGAIFSGNIPFNLSQASGETATGTQQATFDAMNLFLGLLTDPFIDGRGGARGGAGATPLAAEGATAYAAKRQNAARDAFAKFPTKADVARNDLFDPRWSVWGAAYGGGSRTDGNTALGSNDATARAFGFAAGADYRISPATVAGFALAGGGTSFAVIGFGSGRSDLFQAGAFVRHNIGPAYVAAAAAYAWQDVTTDRTVTVAGVDRLRAQFNANAWSGRVEGGYRYVTPWMGVTPYAAGQFTTYSLPAYAEQVLSGANTFALNYAAKDVTASRSELGVRTDRSFAMPNGIFTLRGRAAWAHNFNTDRSITPVFQTLPGAAFVVNGAAQARDAALTTASAEMKWLNGWSAAATFEGEFSHVTRSYAGKGVARYTW